MIELIISKNYLKQSTKIINCYIKFNGDFLKKSNKILLKYNKKIIGKINLKKKRIQIIRNPETGLPLYYSYQKSKIYISDHIKFFIDEGFILKEDKGILLELLTYGYVMPPKTVYYGIKKVLIGQELIMNLNKLATSCKLLMNLTKKNDYYQVEKIKEKILKTFENKESTLLFSGGLDSSILLKLLIKGHRDFNAYSTGFEFEKVDTLERKYASSAAKMLNIKTIYETFNIEELLLNLPEIIKATEEPVTYIQTLLLYILLKKNKNNCFEQIINGQGADGVFGTSQQFSYLHEGGKINLIKDTPDFLKKFKEIEDGKNRDEFISNLRKLNYLDKSFLLILQGDTDITANCWAKCIESLELRVIFPFLHNDLIKIVSKINWDVKLKEPKFILRNLARIEGVSEKIIQRKKGSFGPISQNWNKNLKKLKPLCYGVFPKVDIDNWFEDNEKRYFLWNLINYVLWKKMFIKGEKINIMESKLKKLLY